MMRGSRRTNNDADARAPSKRPRVAAGDDDEEYEYDCLKIDAKARIIYFVHGVNARAFTRVLRALDEFSTGRGKNAEITVKIMSEGGDAFAGMAIHDALKNTSCPIRTEGYGLVASAANIVFAAGHTRAIAPNAHVLIHPVRTALDDEMKLGDLKMELNNTELVQDRFALVLKQLGVPASDCVELLSKESLIDAHHALRIGLATEIMGFPA